MRCWRHPAGQDVAVLKLDRPAADEVRPLRWGGLPKAGDRWQTFGFPNRVVHAFFDEVIEDPALPITRLSESLIQLRTAKAQEGLGGVSGAPCVVDGKIVGLVSFQLQRFSDVAGGPAGDNAPDSLWQESRPSLQTLYALPISLLDGCPVVSPKTVSIADIPLDQAPSPSTRRGMSPAPATSTRWRPWRDARGCC